jgi:hypothetical protein
MVNTGFAGYVRFGPPVRGPVGSFSRRNRVADVFSAVP